MLKPNDTPNASTSVPVFIGPTGNTTKSPGQISEPSLPPNSAFETSCIPLVDYHDEFIAIADAAPNVIAYWRQAVRKIAGQSSIIGFAMHGQQASASLTDFACVEQIKGDVKETLKLTLQRALVQCECHDQTVYQTGVQLADGTFSLIAIPLRIASPTRLAAAVCFALRPLRDHEVVVPAERLRSLLVQAAMHVPNASATAMAQSEESKALTMAGRVAAYRDTREFAYALVGSLVTRYGCGKVSFGLVDNQRVRVLAVSGMDVFKPTSPGVVDVQQAMEEALDAGIVVAGQSLIRNERARAMPIHQRWAVSTRCEIVSVPITAGDETVAVVTLQRQAGQPLSDVDIDGLQKLLLPFGPAIQLSVRGDRGFSEHLKAMPRHLMRQMVTAETRVGQFTRWVILAAVLVFVLGWMPYRPATPCMIVPANLNQSIARFDMKLAEAFVRSGDTVEQGQILARFDTRDLELERARLIASRNQAEVDVRKALAESNAAVASLAKATSRSFQCQLQAVESKIAECTLTAPTDGMVVEADLATKIGQVFPQGEPILAFAPMDQWELQLHVPERMARFIELQQAGSFAPVATPGVKHSYQIESVAGAAEVVDGKNVIVAKASVDGVPAELRHGMKGVARTHTGWRPIWWITLHGVYEYLGDVFWL